MLKHQIGDTALSLALGGGSASVDNTRAAGPAGTARSTQDSRFVSLVGRVAHAFVDGNRSVKPRLDLDIVWASTGGAEESGAGFADLKVKSSTQTLVTLSPVVEFGGEFGDPAGTLSAPASPLD